MSAGPARFVAALVAGACYGLPFVEPALAPLAFVGAAPALVALDGARRRRHVLALSLVTAWTGALLVAWPLETISYAAIVILASFILPWALAAFLVFVPLRRRTGWPSALLWPCCWVVAEWGWSFHSVGRLAFGLSGYTQAVTPRLIQYADLTGVLGVSFLVQVVVGALADAGRAVSAAPAGERGSALRAPRIRVPLLAAAAMIGAALAWGTVRLWTAHDEPGPRLAMVQPAVPHKNDDRHMRFVQMRQLGLAWSIAPRSVDLVAFPENAVLRYIEGSEYLTEFKELSRRLQTPLLVGVAARPVKLPELARADEGYAHNSAALITHEGIVGRYDKLHLIAFSEQVPGERLFAWLGLLKQYRRFIIARLGYMGRAVPGDRVHLLRIPGFENAPMWTPVCFEQADARLAREAALQGARFFVNVTSEGDLGSQIYRNTEAIAVMRAIELRLGVARCGNVGITGIIDPWGRRTHVLRGRTGALWGEPGVLTARVPLGSGKPTLYARIGDWPAGASALVLLAACLASVVRRRAS